MGRAMPGSQVPVAFITSIDKNSMYLAKIRNGPEARYLLRQSFFDRERECYLFRQIFDLGANPGDFINRSDETMLLFREELVEAVAEAGSGRKSAGDLEDLLWEFFSRGEQEYLARFRYRQPPVIRPFTAEDEERLRREIHLFDKKRLYYLRYGAVDQSRIHRLHKKLCRPLFGQCRDEREFSFMEQEKVLSPAEYRTYIFAIFDLQRFFSESFAPYMPEALDQTLMADRLVEEICRLNRDQHFWQGMPGDGWLREHLQRYLVMFFDYAFPRRSYLEDFAREFRARHRTFRWPEKKSHSDEKTGEIFGRTMQELRSMPERELARLFRKRAKELHPDSGGDHERFILLSDAYADLQQRFRR